MEIYLFLILWYILCVYIDKPMIKFTGKYIWAFLLILPLFIITTFKSTYVGSDTPEYFSMYQIFSQQSLMSPLPTYPEAGYVIMNRILGELGLNFFGYQILYSLFVYTVLYWFLVKYSSNIAFSVFFFIGFRFQFFVMTGMRQSIAIAILLLSLPSIVNRKIFKFVFLVIIATLIHNSAITYLLLYFVPIKRLDIRNVAKILTLCILALLSFGFLLDTFVSVFPLYGEYLVRIEQYDGTFVYIRSALIASLLAIGVFIKDPQFQILSKQSDYRSANDCDFCTNSVNMKRVVLNGVVLSLIVSMLAISINIATRIGIYFNILFTIFIPNNIELLANRTIKLYFYAFLIALILMYFLIIIRIRPEWDGVIPFSWL